jgi:hypothetical protein
MFCGECGTENPDTNSFCKNCGKTLKRSPQAVPVPPPPPPTNTVVLQQTVKAPRNWLGIGSVILGILAWLLIPYILGCIAVILGIISIYKWKKERNTLAIAGIAGILIAVAGMLVNFFYIFIF